MNISPLFKPGDLVALRSNPSTVMPVLEVLSDGPECRYRVFQNNAKATYYESQLQAIAADTDERKTLSIYELQARLTSLQLLSPSSANLFSLHAGRVEFVPYQYRPVLKLIKADRPRLLIADEVGVGKTIEAGLIIKELRARMEINSVMIICPKALVAERKWFVEMKRFDEYFTALDGPLLRHCLQETYLGGEWPAQYGKAILPFSLFDNDLLLGHGGGRSKRKKEGLLSLDPPPKFDLVIVDEAHHIRNSETFLHQGVRYFCDNAQAVLLLTATPVQLGSKDLFTLLNVIRPDLVIDRVSFEQMAEPNRHINSAVYHCRAAQGNWQQEARACLDEAGQTDWGALFLRDAPTFQAIQTRLQASALTDTDRIQLIHAIENLYTFSPLISRTRRRDIGEFTSRKPETLTVEFTPQQKRLHDDLLDLLERILRVCHGQENVRFMMTTIRRQAASCLYGLAPLLEDMLKGKLEQLEIMETADTEATVSLNFVQQVSKDIEALVEKARTLDTHDPKIIAFLKVLGDKSELDNNKALVFSTFRHTLGYLSRHAENGGFRYGLIHGGVADNERADLRRRFALPKDDPEALDVLLSSEVGCEGLDFQFCDLLINYDLPWNPMRIEQRIGRIDRYGQQSEAVAIVNFITPDTVDADIYERCLLRIGVFQHSVGGSEEILGEITEEIHHIAENFTLTAEERERRFQQLADNTIRQIQEEQSLEEKQSELFGLNIPKQAWQNELDAAASNWLSPSAIQRCVSMYLSTRLENDVEHILGEKLLKTLRLNHAARERLLEDYNRLPRSNEPLAREWEKWLKGDQPTLSVTFEQKTATGTPTAVHLSAIHPLVRQAALFLRVTEPVYVALSLQTDEVPVGSHPFALYHWKKQGVRPDDTLMPIADDARIESNLLRFLEVATETEEATLPDNAEFDALDAGHHRQWTAAQAQHIADNRKQVEHRIQSLTVSHRARCKIIGDQIARAGNPKIRLMKESELARANADFDRRMAELQQAAESGDIHATAVVFGVIMVHGGQRV